MEGGVGLLLVVVSVVVVGAVVVSAVFVEAGSVGAFGLTRPFVSGNGADWLSEVSELCPHPAIRMLPANATTPKSFFIMVPFISQKALLSNRYFICSRSLGLGG